MTSQPERARFVGPEFHRTQNYLLEGLRLLRRDANLLKTAQPDDELNTRIAQAIRVMGIDAAYDEIAAAVDRAIDELSPLAGLWIGPRAMDTRFTAMTAALLGMAEAADLLPQEQMREGGRPDLSGLSDALRRFNLFAGRRFRRDAADRVRGVYVIIDPSLTNGRDPCEVAAAAIEGGASAVQFRDKAPNKGGSLALAQRLAEVCRERGAAFIVNDHADLAAAVGADGVHVGQRDLPIAGARRALRAWQLVGKSNALTEEAQASLDEGADYVAVGRMFETASKQDTRPAGVETLCRVREMVPADGPPVIAIGGITAANVGEVARAGADGVAVIGEVAQAPDPKAAAARLLDAFMSAR